MCTYGYFFDYFHILSVGSRNFVTSSWTLQVILSLYNLFFYFYFKKLRLPYNYIYHLLFFHIKPSHKLLLDLLNSWPPCSLTVDACTSIGSSCTCCTYIYIYCTCIYVFKAELLVFDNISCMYFFVYYQDFLTFKGETLIPVNKYCHLVWVFKSFCHVQPFSGWPSHVLKEENE